MVIELVAASAFLTGLAVIATLSTWGTFRFERLPVGLQQNAAFRLSVEMLWAPFVALVLWLACVAALVHGLGIDVPTPVAGVYALLLGGVVFAWMIFALIAPFVNYSPIASARRRQARGEA